MEFELLVKQAKQGDKEALVQLIVAKKAEYYKLAYLYTGDKEDALDAMEDMIVSVYENIKGLKDPSSFYSWSKTILVNNCKQLLKKKEEACISRGI